MKTVDIPQRNLGYFRDKVLCSDKCHTWIGGLNSDGYGVFGIRRNKKATFFLAHRIAYELVNGEIPKKLVIDHICRNRACINYKHLRVLTAYENNSKKYSTRHLKKIV